MLSGEWFRAGALVEVRSPEEILSTLDSNGTLDDLPFMPEMLPLCGRRFRVEHRVFKTCVDVAAPATYGNRRFKGDNVVVVLEGVRCDGAAHDGCRRGCKVFWKEQWLRPIDEAVPASPTMVHAELEARLRTRSDDGRFFCQSTQLQAATEPPEGNQKIWQLRVLLRQIRNGDCGPGEAVGLIVRWFGMRARRFLGEDKRLLGPYGRSLSPQVTLNLRPGDRVRIKSREEIIATLDGHYRHRGMAVGAEMLRCCGAEAEVAERIDRLINERTGEMRDIRDTVSLRNMRGKQRCADGQCFCYGQLGDCPRGELMYWREAWLEPLPTSRMGS